MIRYTKELETIAKYDVTVVGSGPAGICAAVAAARRGSKVAIIERYGAVGGNLTVGTVGPLMGSVAKGTMRDELGGMLRELDVKLVQDALTAKGADLFS